VVHTCGYPVSIFPTVAGTKAKKILAVTALLLAAACMAQDQAQPQPPLPPDVTATAQPAQTTESSMVTLPPGTRIALVLTHDVQSRSMRRGDDIYAQITFPVDFGNRVVIAPGTFVQGTVDKLQQKKGRAQLHLQSLSIAFPDGYVATVSAPITLESDEGYALKDPGSRRTIGFAVLPAAGAGLGALIGHSVASSQNSTITSSLPPGCSGPPPGCLSSSLSVPPNKGESTVIGAAVGGAVGVVASLVLLANSHGFFLDVGTPIEMVLPQSLSLPQSQTANAVRDSEQHSVALQPTPRHSVSPPPPWKIDHGTCYTPGTPGTPDVVIPGPPGPNGIAGPPTTIPGTPPTPGTPYPCP
jgi:hypothetical protein